MTHQRTVLKGILSKTTAFEIIIKGPLGGKEVKNLIRKLQIELEILNAPEDKDHE